VDRSKLNCIAACIQANKVGADEALMLDPQGFVATCNSVNFFCVRGGEVWAPTAKYQMAGITRGHVLQLCREHHIPFKELDFSLTQVSVPSPSPTHCVAMLIRAL